MEECSLDDDIYLDPNHNIVEEKPSFTSHGKLSLQNSLKGIKINFPAPQINTVTSISCLKASEKNSISETNLTANEKELYGTLLLVPRHSDWSETQNMNKSFGFGFSKSDAEDESEVDSDEGPDMNSKLRRLKDKSLCKRPSRQSKFSQEEKSTINRIIG